MKARDIMTSPVVAVAPDTAVGRIATLLSERRISAVPVLERGQLAGIVSEADLLRRHEIGTDAAARGSWWRTLFAADRSIEAYIKSHARLARDVMTREVVTVGPDTPVSEVAALLEARRVKRVPVLAAGKVVGMVSRSDIVRALAASARAGESAPPASDSAIRARLERELQRQPWWRGATSQLNVHEGTVVYSGTIDVEAERDAARAAAESIPGVRSVEDRRFLFRDLPSMV
jgi:CBS domain-containing protein